MRARNEFFVVVNENCASKKGWFGCHVEHRFQHLFFEVSIIFVCVCFFLRNKKIRKKNKIMKFHIWYIERRHFPSWYRR